MSGNSTAEFGPIKHYGYLEYQYRLTDGDSIPRFSSQAGTWRAHASTWVWRPYILQLEGDLGLSRTTDSTVDVSQKGTVITGALLAQAFGRSRFPVRIFFEQRDSRAEGGAVDRDLVRQAWGFNQRLLTGGRGSYSLDYRHLNVDELFIDGTRTDRKTASDNWQLTASNRLRRNHFNLSSRLSSLSRDELMQVEDRLTINLRHRFRASSRFYLEDTTFFSDEQIVMDQRDRGRQLFQFNGRSNWQPDTNRPLRVIGRMVLRAAESGPTGFESRASNASVAATAIYQATEKLTLSGNAAVVNSMPDDGPDSSSVIQGVRATYRGTLVDVGRFQYNWGTSVELGNQRARRHGKDTVQNAGASFNHGLSRIAQLAPGRQLSFSFTQSAAARADSLDRREQSLIHSVSASLNRQKGRSSGYLRLSATDRRATGFAESSFQLLALQVSSRMQMSRKRSWNGGINLQYSSNFRKLEEDDSTEGSSVSYSISLSYNERDLFNIRNLEFMSELRMLSSEFRNDDMFDQATDILDERESNYWRNRLRYRVGQLELQLNADIREVNGTRRGQLMFLFRRYYGAV